ncbi:MAG TPA: hypothetical protein VKU41_06205 [Polyangiaceae bacterium]|nr:hypothetical protein [Polyangiaceae bacterium]
MTRGSETAAPSPSAAPPAAPLGAPAPSIAAAASALPLRWDDPAGWRRVAPTSPMRRAEYAVPRVGSDEEDADCAVFMFGPGQGGGVNDNVERWTRQFDPVTSPADQRTREVAGMAVTRVEVAGTYHAMQMPGAAAPPLKASPQRLVGAIVQAPSGLWFFKMVGPDATVKAHAAELDRLVDSIHAG